MQRRNLPIDKWYMKQKVGAFEHLTTKLVCKTVFAKVLAKVSGIHKKYIDR